MALWLYIASGGLMGYLAARSITMMEAGVDARTALARRARKSELQSEENTMRTRLQLSAVILFLCSAVARSQDCQKAISKNRNAIMALEVAIENTKTGAIRLSEGTGFLVSPTGYVLSTYHLIHLVSNDERVESIFGSVGSSSASQRNSLTEVVSASKLDLALLKINDSSREWSVVQFGNPSIAKPGMSLCALGFPVIRDSNPPQRYEFQASFGQLGGTSGPKGRWTTDLPSNAGESGSPVTDVNGFVIAIKWGGDESAQNINVVIPISYASSLLELVAVRIPSGPNQISDPGSEPTQDAQAKEPDPYFLRGDPQTERVQKQIAKIVSSPSPDEMLILEQFSQLFVRPGFMNWMTGDPRQQLYDFCSARLIIQHNMPYIKSGDTRKQLTSIIAELDQLENINARYFKALNVSDHESRYITEKRTFTDTLPADKGQKYFLSEVAPHEKPRLSTLKCMVGSLGDRARESSANCAQNYKTGSPFSD
jgi:S1-C subfamily serine protease